MTQIPNEAASDGFAPCPTCKQYSHSIAKDKLAEAYLHFHTMEAHPVRGHPMGHLFDEKTRDMVKVLIAATRKPDPSALVEALRRICADYENQNLGHEQFRVLARRVAIEALALAEASQ